MQAEDGVAGVSCVEDSIENHKPFDVIFMDNIMPNMTGPTATKLIRTVHNYKGLIVALTGSLLEEDIKEFFSAGATLFIPKPLQMSDLERIFYGTTSFYIVLISFRISVTTTGSGCRTSCHLPLHPPT